MNMHFEMHVFMTERFDSKPGRHIPQAYHVPHAGSICQDTKEQNKSKPPPNTFKVLYNQKETDA